jgi:hypothetical protein
MMTRLRSTGAFSLRGYPKNYQSNIKTSEGIPTTTTGAEEQEEG